jgi:uncharacterized membrane protein
VNSLAFISAFLAAAVEWVEALTIVLAVGAVRGWRSALLGAALAASGLAALVILFGANLAGYYVHLSLARTLIGVLLFLFGLSWLYKAILRASGRLPAHDESKVFEDTRSRLQLHLADWSGLLTSFNGVFLEGLEVVFIVLALGGLHGSLAPAAAGALAASLVVVMLGVLLHAPLTRIPENLLKFVVGIMLTSIGTFFAGEGVGIQWWHDNLMLPLLIGIYAAGSAILIQALRRLSN